MKSPCHKCGEICCRCWQNSATLFCNRVIGMTSHERWLVRAMGNGLGLILVLGSLAWIAFVEVPVRWARTISQLSIFLVLILGASSAVAQRGTNIKPEPTIGALALPVPVFRQTVLRWDNPVGASNVVSWGLARDAWTNGVRVINTNSFFVTNNWHYRVTAIVNGVESTPALWPSNRLGGDLWLVGYGTNMTNPTNIVKLLSYQGNNPPGNMRFWGVKDITTGWE